MKEIKPHNSRCIEVVLKGTPGARIVGIYAPPANRPKADRERFYEEIKNLIGERNNMMPMYIAGDWNVRLHGRRDEERDIMGINGVGRGVGYIGEMSEMTKESR